jgi:arginyl-tRNA synthetase
MRFLGNTAIKEFYVNDAGAQIKKLGESFKIRCQEVLGIHNPLPEGGYQGEYLVYLAKDLIAHQGESVLNNPDSFFEDYAKNALLEAIKKTLARYGITYDVWFSEKSLHDDGSVEKAINLLSARGFTYESEGALWFTSTRFGDDKDRVLRKQTGEWTYVASDVAYLHNKISRGAEHLIMILGQDHHSYVVRLKGIMQALGYSANQLDVILYQLVTIKESGQAVRMSKRAGRIVSLEDVIETVGTDVARFFYLHRKADAHLEFDIDLALKRTEENPVFYIQYAYVRTSSILEKASQHPELEALTNADIQGLTPSEKIVIKKIVALKDLLKNISGNYQTHLLTYYVVELAQLFHKYYTDNRVIDLTNIPQSRARLVLITALRNTFKTCFQLLEITSPDKM